MFSSLNKNLRTARLSIDLAFICRSMLDMMSSDELSKPCETNIFIK